MIDAKPRARHARCRCDQRWFLALLLLACSGSDPATPRAEPWPRSISGSEKISIELSRLYDEYARHRDATRSEPFRPSDALLQVRGERIAVDFSPSGDLQALVRDLERLGVVDLVAAPALGGAALASGWLSISAIPALADLETLRIARAALATTNRPDRRFGQANRAAGMRRDGGATGIEIHPDTLTPISEARRPQP